MKTEDIPWNENLTWPDLVPNLISEAAGIIVSLILITLLGGSLVKFWKKKAFDKRWKSHRNSLSHSIKLNQENINNILIYLPSDIKKIYSKKPTEISSEDLVTLRDRRSRALSGLERIEAFFERNHFCLNDEDIKLAQPYMSFATEKLKPIFQENFGEFSKFEIWLESHVQKTNPLENKISGTEIVRYDIFKEMGASVIENFKKCSTSKWLVQGEKLADKLAG